MYKMSYKLKLIFAFFKMRKSAHTHSYVSFLSWRKNENQWCLVRYFMLDTTLYVSDQKGRSLRGRRQKKKYWPKKTSFNIQKKVLP